MVLEDSSGVQLRCAFRLCLWDWYLAVSKEQTQSQSPVSSDFSLGPAKLVRSFLSPFTEVFRKETDISYHAWASINWDKMMIKKNFSLGPGEN